MKKVKLTKLYTKEQLLLAIEAVNSGTLMIQEASKMYEVPVSTIHVKAKEARLANNSTRGNDVFCLILYFTVFKLVCRF